MNNFNRDYHLSDGEGKHREELCKFSHTSTLLIFKRHVKFANLHLGSVVDYGQITFELRRAVSSTSKVGKALGRVKDWVIFTRINQTCDQIIKIIHRFVECI